MTLRLPKPKREAKPVHRKRVSMRRGQPNKVRKTTLAALRRKLWNLFRDYVKDRDERRCFTCDTFVVGHNCHAGHHVTIGKASTAYDPLNVHVQCHRCNVWLKGNQAEYAFRLMERYGTEKYRDLMRRSRTHRAWKPFEVEELIAAIKVGGAEYEMLYAEKYGL